MLSVVDGIRRDAVSPKRNSPRIAVLIPCLNEGLTIAGVVTDFRKALPTATIYVFDNNSSDDTVQEARSAGAVVRTETRQGKGNVVRRMFADIEADYYLLVDGDATYDAAAAPRLLERAIRDNLDLVNAARSTEIAKAYRRGHRIGNVVLSALVRHVFGRQFTDMLSGYKLLSRRYVKSFPIDSRGFEIETELTVHALELRMPYAEETTEYLERPAGSLSKLSTFHDGARILALIVDLIRSERPLAFFGLSGLALILLSFDLAFPLFRTYLQTGLVPRFPTAILAVGLVITGVLSGFAGLVLDTVTKMRREAKQLAYLSIAPFRRDD